MTFKDLGHERYEWKLFFIAQKKTEIALSPLGVYLDRY